MTRDEFQELTGAEAMRLIVQNMNACNETFLTGFSIEQLVKIFTAHLLCEWDFYPDQWTKRQVKEAIRGVVPQWRETSNSYKPVYTKA